MTEVSLFVDPFSAHFEQDRLFDRSWGTGASENALAPYHYLQDWLRERGVAVHTADLLDRFDRNGATKVYLSFGMRHRYPQVADRGDVALSGFFAFECPIVEPELYLDLAPASLVFRRVFSFSTASALEPFLSGPVELEHFCLPQPFDGVHEGIWGRRGRKFLVLINANKLPRLTLNELYSERLRALEFFARYDEIDLFGFGWDGPPFRVGRRSPVPGAVRRAEYRLHRAVLRRFPPRDAIRTAVRRTYRGPTAAKAETLGAYTFAICFENSILEGWVTEKIFDCFFSGTVPVYLGAPDVDRWIPADCYVDMRRFPSYEELRRFLYDLSPAEIETYRVAARDFLGSEGYAPFAKRTFAERVGRMLVEDAGVDA